MSEKEHKVPEKKPKQTPCPWHINIEMEEFRITHFPHRKVLKAKKCPVCGFMALFDTTNIVRVGDRKVGITTSYGTPIQK